MMSGKYYVLFYDFVLNLLKTSNIIINERSGLNFMWVVFYPAIL